MKKNGFTLIELLAVIVILAIIALIATPIILGIINDAKKESQERSAELYLSALDLAIARRNLTGEFSPEECTITQGVVTCAGYEDPLIVEVDGEVPVSGIIKFENNKAAKDTTLTFEGFSATIKEDGKLELSTGTTQETPKNEETPDNETTQETQPLRYYAWDLSGTIGTTSAPSNPTTVPPAGKNIYLGYEVTNGVVSAAYACFVRNETEFCLKGYDTAAYTTNVDVIRDAFVDVVDTSACSFGGNPSYCNADNLEAVVASNGELYVSNFTATCSAVSDGSFSCYEY